MNKEAIRPMMRHRDMQALVDYAANTYGDKPAYRWKEKQDLQEKTFAELKQDTMAFSRFLESQHLLGDHIAVVGMSSYLWVVTYLGTVNSGSVIVPLDKELLAEDLAELIARSHSKVLVYDDSISDRIEEIQKQCPHVMYLSCGKKKEASSQDLSTLLTEHQGDFNAEIDREKLCAILYTSGTTGKPKGVMLTHKSLVDNATCVDMGEPNESVVLTVLPIHHAYCFTCDILVGLTMGNCVCFNDSMMRLVKNLSVFQPEILLLVPMILEGLLFRLKEAAAAKPEIPAPMLAQGLFGGKLRTIYSGGAYLHPAIVEGFAAFGIAVLQGYGMTEYSPRITVNTKENQKVGSVGFLVPGCTARVVDGELQVQGDSRMLGYYEDEDNTKEALQDGWLCTGDLGEVDEDGFVFLTGRKKNLIILSSGENVSPEELEQKFAGWYVAKELLVYAKNNKITLAVFPNEEYIEKAGILDVEQAVKQKVEEINRHLPLYKRIEAIELRETEFDKTTSQKIKRNLT